MKAGTTIAVCLVLAAVGAAAAFAEDTTTTEPAATTSEPAVTDPGTTATDPAATTGTSTATDAATAEPAPPPAPEPPPEPPPPPEPRIAAGVTIAGVAVGSMTAEEARAAVAASWRTPLRLRLRTRTWTVMPYWAGARANISIAIERALAAAPGAVVALPVYFDHTALRRYVARVARHHYRPPVDSRVKLRNLRPYITRARNGIRVRQYPTRLAIRREVKAYGRGPVAVRWRALHPRVTRANFGPVIVIRRESHRLYLYNRTTLWRVFGVATGMPQYPTPIGRFHIVSKVRWPWWYPPAASWAAGARPVPPGPNNPLGTRWMGLSVGGVGIHGTPSAWSIGYSASHGCIRMRIPEAEWLFKRVRIGTPVFIVRA